MFITTDENMSKTDYELNLSNDGFNPFEDIEVLSRWDNWCMISTRKLLPTMEFMQDAWWRIREIVADDEYVSWVPIEKNILTYYKPKCKTT